MHLGLNELMSLFSSKNIDHINLLNFNLGEESDVHIC